MSDGNKASCLKAGACWICIPCASLDHFFDCQSYSPSTFLHGYAANAATKRQNLGLQMNVEVADNHCPDTEHWNMFFHDIVTGLSHENAADQRVSASVLLRKVRLYSIRSETASLRLL